MSDSKNSNVQLISASDQQHKFSETERSAIVNEATLEVVQQFRKLRKRNDRRFRKLRIDYRRRDWFLIAVTIFAFITAMLAWVSILVSG